MFEKIYDKIFDLTPGFLYRFYNDWLKWSSLNQKIRFWWQRRTRGWDDSETWSLDDQFYSWLLPRLKRFNEVNGAYPFKYKSYKSWEKELKNRIKQLEIIIKYKYTEWDFDDKYWLNQIKNKENKNNINSLAYYKCLENFNKWIGENINNLWW